VVKNKQDCQIYLNHDTSVYMGGGIREIKYEAKFIGLINIFDDETGCLYRKKMRCVEYESKNFKIE